MPRFRFEMEIVLVKIELEMQSWLPGFLLAPIMNRMTERNTGYISYLLAYRCISISTVTSTLTSPHFSSYCRVQHGLPNPYVVVSRVLLESDTSTVAFSR